MIWHVQNENFILDSTRIFMKAFHCFSSMEVDFPRMYPNFWPNSSSDDRFNL
ncbi:hypothetical protein HanHA300_Chr00c0782g0811701 [Helianthus annuus]|nr:hypothetical protein HanHA300_Chr00c0782g0811701 [Helianthus annuus]